MEQGVAAAIAKAVHGKVIHVRYTFRSAAGDIDCFVEGEMNGVPVIVFAECKRNLDNLTTCKKAFSQATQAVRSWKELIEPPEAPDDAEYMDDRESDRVALQVDRLKDHEIVFAFGSDIVTDKTVKFFSEKNFRGSKYFLIKPDEDGKYVKV